MTIDKSIQSLSIVLLNPPYKSKILRDNFCSHSSKAGYVWPPVDLLYLTAHFRDASFTVHVIDAVALNLSWDSVTEKIKQLKPYALLTLTSSLSINEDIEGCENILSKISDRPLFGVIGNLPFFKPDLVKTNFPSIDFIVRSFLFPELINFSGKSNLLTPVLNSSEKKLVPQYDLFPIEAYNIPSAQRHPMTSMLTAEGCPYACQFCVASEIKLKIRGIESLKSELDEIERNGIKEIFFLDSTFNSNVKFLADFLPLLKSYNFTWSANIHCAKVNKDLLMQMRDAGCHTVNIGIESGSQKTLDKYAPSKSIERLSEVFTWIHELGLKSLGYAIVGFPEETLEEIKETISFTKKLNPTFASFSLLIPDYGTSMFDAMMIESNTIVPMDHSTSKAWDHAEFVTSKIEREKMIRNAYLSFYLQPQKVFNLLKNYPLLKTFKSATQLALRYTRDA